MSEHHDEHDHALEEAATIKSVKIASIFITLLFGTVFGLLPHFIKTCRTSTKYLGVLNAFSGGIFFGIGWFHWLPHAVEKFAGYEALEDVPLAYFLAFISYALIFLIEKVIFNAHSLLHDHQHPVGGHDSCNEHGGNHCKDVKDKHKEGKDVDNEVHRIKVSKQDDVQQNQETEQNLKQTEQAPEAIVIKQNVDQANVANEDGVKTQKEGENEENMKNSTSSKGQLSMTLHVKTKNGTCNPDPQKNKEVEISSKLLKKSNSLNITEDGASDAKKTKVINSYLLLVALGFHGIFEGLALGVQDELKETLFFLLAICAHEWASSLALGISFVKASLPRMKFMIMLFVFGIICPLGIIIGWIVSENATDLVVGICLSLGTGTFWYVACTEVLVEEFAWPENKILKFVMFIIGGAFTAGITFLEKLTAHEH